jgi:hypothetical protein
MGLDEMLHDGKAEARASNLTGPPRIHSVESLEDPWEMLRWNSNSRVAHSNDHSAFLPARENRDAAGLRVAYGVLDQVLQDLAERGGIGEHVIGAGRDLDAEVELSARGIRLHEREGVGGRRPQIDINGIR